MKIYLRLFLREHIWKNTLLAKGLLKERDSEKPNMESPPSKRANQTNSVDNGARVEAVERGDKDGTEQQDEGAVGTTRRRQEGEAHNQWNRMHPCTCLFAV